MIGPGDPRRPSRAPRPAVVLEAQRLSGHAGQPHGGECTYSVAEPRRPIVRTGEQRDTPRRRTRLRTGKVLDASGRVLTDCLIYDRSEHGARLRLSTAVVLPRSVLLYEDQIAALLTADVVWRRDQEAGLRMRPAVTTPRLRKLEAEMRSRLHARRQ